jgi:hypothetical protein
VASSTWNTSGVLHFTFEQFCNEPLFAAEAHITVLKRYKYRRGLKHEFILAVARTGESAAQFWVRIDRAAASDSSISALSSDVTAKDSVSTNITHY